MTAWSITYEGFEPAEEGLREALCTLGNGYVATRGACPEATADEVHYPGTYAAGVFNRLATDIAGRTVENESMVNLPNWLCFTFRIEDGEWFSMASVEVLEHRLELDIRHGVLVRHTRFRDAAGRTTRLTQRRFVHMELPHVAGLETTIVAEGWSGRLVVRSGIDGNVRNCGVPRYRALDSLHLDVVATDEVDADTVLLVTETNQSHVRIGQAARTIVRDHGTAALVGREFVRERGLVAHDIVLDVREGADVVLEKIATLYTGRDAAVSEPGLEARTWVARAGGFEDLLERQVLAWSHLWDRFHLDLEGDERALQILRLHLLHVLQTVCNNSEDLDVGVPPRGLHGEAYRGHIFWDELFILPIISLRLPLLTQSLLKYRYRRLPEARWAAQQAGYEGAMFPWQSGSDGREENQVLHLNPKSGHWTPDVTHLQRHIGLAVAVNVWQAYQVSGDREFLRGWAGEVILEVARFFASLAEYDRGRDRYVIRGVMGPDEFHTSYPGAEHPGIDNNAYTNVLAVWVLMRAIEVLDLLPERARHELTERLGLRRQDVERWEHITHKMFVPFHDGVISQFEGYGDLDELDWVGLVERYGDIQRLDRILEAEGDSPNRYKASKQADVLMLFYVLSVDEVESVFARLGYELDDDTILRTIDYYLHRTSHGSTLSAVVHAWVLARAEREEVLDYFLTALEADITDIQGGTTAEGVHLAAMAGSVDLVLRCFAGVELRGDVLWLDPYWPAELGSLEVGLRYREQPVMLRVVGNRFTVSTGEGTKEPIRVGFRGAVVEVGPSQTLELSL